jgi:hypothetical protein
VQHPLHTTYLHRRPADRLCISLRPRLEVFLAAGLRPEALLLGAFLLLLLLDVLDLRCLAAAAGVAVAFGLAAGKVVALLERLVVVVLRAAAGLVLLALSGGSGGLQGWQLALVLVALARVAVLAAGAVGSCSGGLFLILIISLI